MAWWVTKALSKIGLQLRHISKYPICRMCTRGCLLEKAFHIGRFRLVRPTVQQKKDFAKQRENDDGIVFSVCTQPTGTIHKACDISYRIHFREQPSPPFINIIIMTTTTTTSSSMDLAPSGGTPVSQWFRCCMPRPQKKKQRSITFAAKPEEIEISRGTNEMMWRKELWEYPDLCVAHSLDVSWFVCFVSLFVCFEKHWNPFFVVFSLYRFLVLLLF